MDEPNPGDLAGAAAHPSLAGWLGHVGAHTALAQLAALLPDAGVFVVDEERRILLWSQGAERLLGFRAEDVLGEHCLKANRCGACIAACGIAERTHVHGERLTLFAKDGSQVPLKKHAQAFFHADGSFAGGVEVLLPDERASPEPYVLPKDAPGLERFHELLTTDAAMKEVLALVRRIARSDTTVLIRGESGSGKELVARALHEESHRKKQPFIAFNCAAMSDSLLESQLFGHVRGAFTGAVRDHAGLFEQADGGTLFLDEVAEIPLDLQAKLLRVLEERTFTRVGAQRPVKVDVRIVSATHRSLRALVAQGRFREDLMYRLRVVPIFLPPLRDRRGDIALLAEHFLARQSAASERKVRRFAPDAMRALLDHRWPGNVRELQNVILYAHAVGHGDELRFEDLPPEFRDPSWPSAEPAGARAVDDEETVLKRALKDAGGHIGKAAASLGMSRATFWRKRKRYGV